MNTGTTNNAEALRAAVSIAYADYMQRRNAGATEIEAFTWSVKAMLAALASQPQAAGAGGDAAANDREMLHYLMQQFDCESFFCERCGHGEPTADCDSAIALREYLAATPAPAVERERAEARTNGDGSLDEVVGYGEFHLEQMSGSHWSLRLGPFLIGLHSARAIKTHIVRDTPPAEAREPVGVTDAMVARAMTELRQAEADILGEAKTPDNGARRACLRLALEAAQPQATPCEPVGDARAVECTCHYMPPRDCPHLPHQSEPDTRLNAPTPAADGKGGAVDAEVGRG